MQCMKLRNYSTCWRIKKRFCILSYPNFEIFQEHFAKVMRQLNKRAIWWPWTVKWHAVSKFLLSSLKSIINSYESHLYTMSCIFFGFWFLKIKCALNLHLISGTKCLWTGIIVKSRYFERMAEKFLRSKFCWSNFDFYKSKTPWTIFKSP